MDSLFYGPASCLHKTNCSTSVAASSVAKTTQLITAAPAITVGTRSKKHKEKYQRNCSDADQESRFLLDEIMVEIFCRLDAQTLLKVKSVCKQWRALIEDPVFVKEHASRALVLLRHHRDEVGIRSQQIQAISTYNGLILERVIGNASEGKYRVRNPAIRRVFDLPHPHEQIIAMNIFYAPSSGCYKLISVYGDKDKALIEGVDVLALGSVDEPTWRFLDATLLRNFYERHGSFWIQRLKGVVHFCPKSRLVSKDFELVSLDMDEECFTSTMLPRSFSSDSQANVRVIGYECPRNLWYLSVAEIVKDELRLLVLEDYRKSKWAEKNITIPLTFLKENSDMKSAQPRWASPWCVWLSMNGETRRYDIKSQQMTKVKGPLPENKKLFLVKETLVTFKGMRSEE